MQFRRRGNLQQQLLARSYTILRPLEKQWFAWISGRTRVRQSRPPPYYTQTRSYFTQLLASAPMTTACAFPIALYLFKGFFLFNCIKPP